MTSSTAGTPVIPTVSIIILNYNHPEMIDICLRQVAQTTGVDYEVVVVDNGSAEQSTIDKLLDFKEQGFITTLVLSKENNLFSGGNNIGVDHSNPASKYLLLLNSDAAPISPNWLTKMLDWMEGTVTHTPSVWNAHPTVPSPGPKDIVSFGWSHDINVQPGRVRPEGWCCMYRREVWQDMSIEFPWHYGFEQQIGNIVRTGARCGVLWHYQPYIVHREGGSNATDIIEEIIERNTGVVDIEGWLSGLPIETLDFTIGDTERDSYLDW